MAVAAPWNAMTQSSHSNCIQEPRSRRYRLAKPEELSRRRDGNGDGVLFIGLYGWLCDRTPGGRRQLGGAFEDECGRCGPGDENATGRGLNVQSRQFFSGDRETGAGKPSHQIKLTIRHLRFGRRREVAFEGEFGVGSRCRSEIEREFAQFELLCGGRETNENQHGGQQVAPPGPTPVRPLGAVSGFVGESAWECHRMPFRADAPWSPVERPGASRRLLDELGQLGGHVPVGLERRFRNLHL